MAQPNPPPRILGTAPEPYNGKGDTAIAFWNALENYFTVNATTFDTNAKKVLSALTYFKQGTQAGDWASNHIATILARNPVNYGTWDDFRDAFKAQFIPPETQNEVIQNIHNTPQRNREFGEWYQEWSRYARQANVDEATKMYAFCRALDTALHNKLLQLSPMPTTLAGLVEKAREFDKNWRTFAGPTRGFRRQNPHIWEILEEESKINAFHNPLLSDRTKDEDADMAMAVAVVVEDSPWKNANAVSTITSVSIVAYLDTLLSTVPHCQTHDLVPVSDYKAVDRLSNKSIPFQKKGWRNCHLKMKANLILLLLTNSNHWSNSI